MMTKFTLVASLASATLLLTTSLALAAPNAVALDDADVHQNHSNGSAVVNSISQDDQVMVTKCSGSWCFIKVPGPDGWVKKKVLGNIDDSGDPVTTAPFNFSMAMGPGGPVISFGNGNPPPAPPAPPAPAPGVAKACFFADPSFGGASACYTPGDSDANMAITGPGYDNSISSIKLTGGAKAKVCTDANFAGSCATFSSDKPFLGGYNDAISSFQVY